MKQVIKFVANDGREFSRIDDADAHNFYLKVRGALRFAAGPTYSPGYDGPMPMYEPTLETLCQCRSKVRHLFLEVDPPEPEVQIKTEVETRYRDPWWILLAGIIIGMMIVWLF